MTAFDENLNLARENEAELERLLDIAKRDVSAGKAGAQQDADRLQALLDATHDPVAEDALFESLLERGAIDEDGESIDPDAEPEPVDDDEDDEPDPDAVPDGSIEVVLGWVHGGAHDEAPTEGWRDRAEKALRAEQTGQDRKGIVEPLTRALAEPPAEPAQAPAGSEGTSGAPQA